MSSTNYIFHYLDNFYFKNYSFSFCFLSYFTKKKKNQVLPWEAEWTRENNKI